MGAKDESDSVDLLHPPPISLSNLYFDNLYFETINACSFWFPALNSARGALLKTATSGQQSFLLLPGQPPQMRHCVLEEGELFL